MSIIFFIIKEYCISQWIHTSNKALTLSLTISGLCCIETSPLICSASQWTGFCMLGTSVMKELRRSPPTILWKSVLTCHTAELAVFVCFCIWIFFHDYSRFTGQQRKWEAISLYPFYHLFPLHDHLDITWVIIAERSP